MKVRLTIKSNNRKTGPIPVSTSTANTCPDACPFKSGGCYAKGGPVAIVWKETETRGISWEEFCSRIESLPENQLWRHNQAGDLPGENDTIDSSMLELLVNSNMGRRGFTYTHKPVTSENLEYIRRANDAGFTINLSGNNLQHADELAETGLPVVTVLPADYHGQKLAHTPAGRKVLVCPATYRDNVSCASCGICQKVDRPFIVGFPAHGVATAKANAIAEGA